MTPSLVRRLAIALCAFAGLAAAERWEVRYLYDEAKSDLAINDLAFPTPQRGVAVGAITRGERFRGTAVVTSDGGATWSLVPLPDTGLSVFFLNDTLGWVVTPKGIYRSDEGGRSWRKLPKSPKGALRVWFLDPERGYSVGLRKSIHATADGGKSWQALPAAAEVKTSADYTVFTSISFAGPVGYITGWSRPPRLEDDERLPDWMEPERAARRREVPNVSVLVATRDAGKTWETSAVSIFGRIGRVRISPDGRALGLVEFPGGQYPNQVFRIDLRTGKSEPVYSDKLRAATDFTIPRAGPAYLAAPAVTGRLRAPIPSRLHMLVSEDMKLWREMEVDYRADARRAVLAAPDAQNVWVATDTGMILKLVP